jgi:mono/diheme cytochrome c family protein
MCHNGAGAPAGLILSTYEDAMKGGKNGPVIVANDSANSKLVIVQSGTHFANLSADELTLVKQWIDTGAAGGSQPPAAEATATPTAEATIPATPSGAPTYEGIAAVLTAKCVMCHQGAAAPGGLDLTSYANLMKGGEDGAVIVAGNSGTSMLITVQSNPHAVNLTPDELTLFKQWIDAGALEK